MLKMKLGSLFRIIEKSIKTKKLLILKKLRNYAEEARAKKANIQQGDNSLNIISNNKNVKDKKFNEYENENSFLLMQEILQKIKAKALIFFKLYDKKMTLAKQNYFIKWKESGKYQKYLDSLRSEVEKKIKIKYEIKFDESEKTIKKYMKENIELKSKIDSFENKYLNYQKKVSEFEIKEKEYIKQNKSLLEEKKKNSERLKQMNIDLKQSFSKLEIYMNELDKSLLEEKKKNSERLKQMNIDLKQSFSKLEIYMNELDKSYEFEKESQSEKEHFLNTYINEMNSLLDFYEMKSSKNLLSQFNTFFVKSLLH